MPFWYVFILLRLAAVFFIARPRLDVVRVLAVFAILEVGYFYLWRHGVVAGYRRDFEESVPSIEIFGEYFSQGRPAREILVTSGLYSLRSQSVWMNA